MWAYRIIGGSGIKRSGGTRLVGGPLDGTLAYPNSDSEYIEAAVVDVAHSTTPDSSHFCHRYVRDKNDPTKFVWLHGYKIIPHTDAAESP